MTLPEGPTKIVVGGAIGAAMVVAIFSLVGWRWGLGLSALLAYEAWTFFNRYKYDTISDVIWEFAKRPLVPMLFGLGIGWALATRFITDPYVAWAIGFLFGHFFFQRHEER